MRAKPFATMAALGIGLAMGGFGCAAQHNTETERYNYLTGSYMPQDVERNGPVSNGQNNVRVIDRSDINGSGGGDVNQTLRQLGVH
jgi:hypothetical protein